MPVLTVNGDKKKVACGPCIRGHRSSKCAHKDRVLIEVRKPGRPLGVCPHPAGSCSCERVVINYVIPKSSECPCPGADGVNQTSYATTSKVQKNKGKRSVSNLAQSTVQKVIDGDPSALAALAKIAVDSSSDASGQSPSAASSTSSTPLVDAIDNTHGIQDPSEQATRFQARRVNEWGEEWSRFAPYPRPTTASSEVTGATSMLSEPQSQVASCCQPQPEEPSSSVASCCQPAEPAQLQHHPRPQQGMARLQPERSGSYDSFNNPNLNAMQSGLSGVYEFPEMTQEFLAYESSIGCGGMQNGQASIQQRLSGMYTDHSCECGDGCTCFACATHPNNRTTTEYVRYHNDLFTRYAQVPGHIPTHFSGPPLQPSLFPYQFAPTSPPPYAQTQEGLQPQFVQAFSPQGLMFGENMQWQTSTAPLIRRTTAELNHFHPQHPPQSMLPLMMPVAFQTAPSQAFSQQQAAGPLSVTIKQDQKAPLPKENLSPLVSTPMPFDPESPSDDDASTLSPSSFLLQQFTLPGCNDVTGTCACGDGCECPGCLTHSGHNREPGSQITDSLEHSSLSSAHEVDSFSLESDNHEEIFAPAVPG